MGGPTGHGGPSGKPGWALPSKQRAFPLKDLEKQSISGESHSQETNTIQIGSNCETFIQNRRGHSLLLHTIGLL